MDVEIERLAQRVGVALGSHGYMLATAESCTGGGIAAAVTSVPGSSGWFERGFVTYSDQAKIDLLGVGADTLAAAGAVSEAVAAQMADGALAHSRAQIALAVTGIAGPGGATPGKPVGTVCFGWAAIDATPVTETLQFPGDRAAVRRAAALHALRGAWRLLPDRTGVADSGPRTNS